MQTDAHGGRWLTLAGNSDMPTAHRIQGWGWQDLKRRGVEALLFLDSSQLHGWESACEG